MSKEKKIYGIATGGNLNIRKEPSTASSIVKVLKDGDKIQIKESGEAWHKVTGGYVMAKYITIAE